MAWLLGKRGSEKSPLGLKALAKTYLNMDMRSFEDVAKGKTFDLLHPKDAIDYACDDAYAALKLGLAWSREMHHVPSIEKTYREVDLPFIRVLLDMEMRGVGVDSQGLCDVYESIQPRLDEIVRKWGELFPGVSISSPKQISAALYGGVWSTAGVKERATGYDTSKRAVMIARDRAIRAAGADSIGALAADLKLEYQYLHKQASTYTLGLVEIANQYPDKRLHPSFMQTGTATGRLSSSYPNAQNISVHSQLGIDTLRCLIPSEGSALISADYSQIELRVLAHMSGGALRAEYLAGADVHQSTADLVGCTRDQAKTLNFAMLYGAHNKKLAEQLGIGVGRAKELREGFWRGRPEVLELQQSILENARDVGYVETLLGHRRYIPELVEFAGRDTRYMPFEEKLRLWGAERQAFNTVIQGGAADIVRLGMIKAHQRGLRMITQIHDDIIIESDNPDEDAATLRECLESAYPLYVPLVAEPKIGYDWAELKGHGRREARSISGESCSGVGSHAPSQLDLAIG
jgi:DNA polymerase-1